MKGVPASSLPPQLDAVSIWVGRIVLALSVLTAFPAPLAAQTVDPQQAARRLANEAADRFDTGNYAEALDLFQRAGQLYPAPTLLFWEGQCHERLGHLLAAEKAYNEVAVSDMREDAPEAFQSVAQKARDALAILGPRIPTLKVVVRGGEYSSVTVNAVPLPRPLVGAPAPFDPGQYTVDVTWANGSKKSLTIDLVEGEKRQLVMEVAVQEKVLPPPPVAPMRDAPMPPLDRTEPGGGITQSTWGWIGVSAGAAGIALGVGTGIAAMVQHSDLEAACPDSNCPAGMMGDIDAFRTNRTLSTVGYIVGAVGVVGGVTLILTAPSEAEAGVSAFVGPTRVGVTGRF